MNYVINDKRLHDAIYRYIDRRLEPDYSWGPSLHEFYRQDVQDNGFYSFEVNDRHAFTYTLREIGQKTRDKGLVVAGWVANDLSEYFGDRWKPVFIEWFENNTGLEVEELITPPFK